MLLLMPFEIDNSFWRRGLLGAAAVMTLFFVLSERGDTGLPPPPNAVLHVVFTVWYLWLAKQSLAATNC